MSSIVPLSAALALALAGTAPQPPTAAQPALLHGAPWQVEIYSNFAGYSDDERKAKPLWELAHRCGGSLIADHWVLTAAHCVNQQQVDKGWRVRLGTRDLASGRGITYLIDRVIRHGRYDPGSHVNDIALLHFSADAGTVPGNAGKIGPIRLNGSRATDGVIGSDVPVTATGWGKSSEGPNGRSTQLLMAADLKSLACASAPAYAGRTDDTMLCAAAPGEDSCQGDSGGPLILTDGDPVLVGIVSWGDGCAEPGHPGVYVRIDRDHYLDWIKRAMAADPQVRPELAGVAAPARIAATPCVAAPARAAASPRVRAAGLRRLLLDVLRARFFVDVRYGLSTNNHGCLPSRLRLLIAWNAQRA